MKQFLEWLTKSGTFWFNNEYFEQNDGVPMGGKASNLFSDVIMNYSVDKAKKITPLQYRPFFFAHTLMIASTSSMIKNRLLNLRKF